MVEVYQYMMFENLPFRPPTVKWKADVFKDLHSVEFLEKMHFPWPFSPDTCGQSAKPVINLPFHKKTANMCGRDELMWVMVLQRLILCLVRLITLQQALHTSQLLRCPVRFLGNFGVPSFRRHSAEPLHSTSVKSWLTQYLTGSFL